SSPCSPTRRRAISGWTSRAPTSPTTTATRPRAAFPAAGRSASGTMTHADRPRRLAAQRLGAGADRLHRLRGLPVLLALPPPLRARARRDRPVPDRDLVRGAPGGDPRRIGAARP